MFLNISKQILIDHHAHSIREQFLQIDAIGLRQAFSETMSLAQLQDHVVHSVSYIDFICRLGQFLDVQGEDEILRLRERMRESDYVNMLLDDASIGAFIIDDGFGSEQFMPLSKFANLCERPTFRCRRIERALEETLMRASNFQQAEETFAKILFEETPQKIVALKTIAAYRGGLELSTVSRDEAERDFERTKNALIVKDKPRIFRGDLYHYFLQESFILAQKESLPVQVHSGLGDRDQDLIYANPLYMRRILDSPRFKATRFVFLHCFPYVRETAYLCSIYPNVFMDISLVNNLASPAVSGCFADALAVAPASKILAATDGHSLPETYWHGAHTIKRGLETSLHQLIDDQFLDAETASSIAGLILHGNATKLYQLDGLK
jgi:predicted TIM-barrel fold metal-dependent hydrolase